MQSYPSSSSAPTTDIGTASDTLTVGVSGNVICLHTNSPFRRESDWERPRKVKDLKVDVKLERSAEGGWSFSLDDLKKEFEKQAITSYRGTWSGVCNEAFDRHTFDPIETIHIPVTGTCSEGHEFNPYLSMCYEPEDLDLTPGFPKDHHSMGLTTWDVKPSISSPSAYSWPANTLSSMAYHGRQSLKLPDDTYLVRMRPFFCRRHGCLGTVTSIESGGDKIHFSVEPTRTDESGGKEDHHSYRAVITAWRETDSGEEGQGQTETGPETNREILLSQPAIV